MNNILYSRRNGKSALLSVVVTCFLMLSSCSSDPIDPEPGIPADGTGFLSIDMVCDDIAGTRADQGEAGIAEESIFNTILFILYDAVSGTAERIDRYTLNDDGTVAQATDAPGNLSVDTDADGKPLISKLFDKIAVKQYRLAVIINSGAPDRNLNAVHMEQGGGTLLGGKLSEAGHNISVLETPLELSQYGKGGQLMEKGIGHALTAMDLSFPDNLDMTPTGTNTSGMRILMTNADGISTIGTGDIYASEAESQQNRKNLRVERAVAKVVVFRNLDENNLSYGGSVADFRWTCDVINHYTYLIRRPWMTAPAGGGALETAVTDRKYRYALDPNFDDLSNERSGNLNDLSDHFFSLNDVNDTDLEQLFFKTWNMIPPTSPAEDWKVWEYVTENTMDAGEQYEDVTTRVVVRCNYIPGNGNSTGVIHPSESYYYFNGLAITSGQMAGFYSDPASIPVSEYPGLMELGELMSDPEVAAGFGWNGTFADPTVSTTVKGISFYMDGISYYRVLIRHFDDTLSPDMMGYGRYGVVRNNVYRISINDIRGPGSVTIPDPEGPDDKKYLMDVKVEVTPWRYKGLIFEL